MKIPAVGLFEFGGPEVLRMVEIPLREPGPGQVRVRVRAAAVNPTDTLFREGLTRAGGASGIQWPLVPGWDLAGVVVAVGEDSAWRVGDEVAGVVLPGVDSAPGAYASEVIVADDSLIRLPAGSSFTEACTLLMNGLTAMHAVDLLAVPPGGTLGVTGAAGAVGGYAIGLAKQAGIRVVADAKDSDVELVESFGADVVVPRGDGVERRFLDAAGGPLDGVLDAALTGPVLAAAVKDGGGFAAVRPVEWELERGITRHDVRVPYYIHSPGKLNRLRELVEKGVLALRVAGTYAPEEAAQAHRDLAAGGVRGRLVIEWPA